MQRSIGHFGQERILILDSVCLIDDDISPVELFEIGFLFDDHLIGCHTNVKSPRHHLFTKLTCLDQRSSYEPLGKGHDVTRSSSLP